MRTNEPHVNMEERVLAFSYQVWLQGLMQNFDTALLTQDNNSCLNLYHLVQS